MLEYLRFKWCYVRWLYKINNNSNYIQESTVPAGLFQAFILTAWTLTVTFIGRVDVLVVILVEVIIYQMFDSTFNWLWYVNI